MSYWWRGNKSRSGSLSLIQIFTTNGAQNGIRRKRIWVSRRKAKMQAILRRRITLHIKVHMILFSNLLNQGIEILYALNVKGRVTLLLNAPVRK